MRGAWLVLLLLAAGCSVRQQCAASCKGCCDLNGRCFSGADPYACGGAGDCRVCLAGQVCVPDAGCSGQAQSAVLQLAGNNVFVPLSAQGFTYGSGEGAGAFVILSERKREACRDPAMPPNVDEEVLIASSPRELNPQLERVSFVDGGVVRRELMGSMTIRTEGPRVLSTVDIDSASLKLRGSIDAPFCGQMP